MYSNFRKNFGLGEIRTRITQTDMSVHHLIIAPASENSTAGRYWYVMIVIKIEGLTLGKES